MNESPNGNLFNSLTEEEKEKLILSCEESFDESNLISHELIKLQHEKWLNSLPGTAE